MAELFCLFPSGHCSPNGAEMDILGDFDEKSRVCGLLEGVVHETTG